MDETVIEKIEASGLEAQTYWSYDIDHEGDNLIFSFRSRPYLRRIRHHTSPSYYPLMDVNVSRGDRQVVTPGQWLEGLVDGRWSFLIDADNR